MLGYIMTKRYGVTLLFMALCLIFIIFIIFIACSNAAVISDNKESTALAALQAENDRLLAMVTDLESSVLDLEAVNNALKIANADLIGKIDSVNAINDRQYPLISVYGIPGISDKYIALEETLMYYTPSDVGRVMSGVRKGGVVDVFAHAHADNSEDAWILAKIMNFAESVNVIGWIPLSPTVLPLTEELSTLATDHIRVSEDCVDHYTGKYLSEVCYSVFTDVYFGINNFDRDMVSIYTTGGVSFLIESKYIIYPKP